VCISSYLVALVVFLVFQNVPLFPELIDWFFGESLIWDKDLPILVALAMLKGGTHLTIQIFFFQRQDWGALLGFLDIIIASIMIRFFESSALVAIAVGSISSSILIFLIGVCGRKNI
jgi:hypothetical protein